jgi:ribosome-associated protein
MTDRKVSRLPKRVRAVVEAIEDRKGTQVLVLDLRGLCDATDYFVIASGMSTTHVRGLADNVMQMMDKSGQPAHHAEGLATGHWVLLDCNDVVVHLFHPETRAFYQLERLWQDAPALHSEP